jgi:hypothetical protein
VEFYSAIKKNEIMSFSGKWMELQIAMLNEISQSGKDAVTCFLSCVACRIGGRHESKRQIIKGMWKRKGGEGGM